LDYFLEVRALFRANSSLEEFGNHLYKLFRIVTALDKCLNTLSYFCGETSVIRKETIVPFAEVKDSFCSITCSYEG
jgi:hypothetical protein